MRRSSAEVNRVTKGYDVSRLEFGLLAPLGEDDKSDNGRQLRTEPSYYRCEGKSEPAQLRQEENEEDAQRCYKNKTTLTYIVQIGRQSETGEFSAKTRMCNLVVAHRRNAQTCIF